MLRTNRQTYKQTDSKILPTPTDRVGVHLAVTSNSSTLKTRKYSTTHRVQTHAVIAAA